MAFMWSWPNFSLKGDTGRWGGRAAKKEEQKKEEEASGRQMKLDKPFCWKQTGPTVHTVHYQLASEHNSSKLSVPGLFFISFQKWQLGHAGRTNRTTMCVNYLLKAGRKERRKQSILLLPPRPFLYGKFKRLRHSQISQLRQRWYIGIYIMCVCIYTYIYMYSHRKRK